jgi:hypothetical protein
LLAHRFNALLKFRKMAPKRIVTKTVTVVHTGNGVGLLLSLFIAMI